VFCVISPAKKLDFETSTPFGKTVPQLMKDVGELAESTCKLTATDLQRLMKLSPSLAELNFQRFQQFDARAKKPVGSKPAALAFDGDTYVGLRATEFDAEEMAFAQEHLGILSGLYGLLRPLDAILPYRLEMGTSLKTKRGKTLYDFWGDKVAVKVNQQLGKLGSDCLVNLASKEYFTVLDRPSLKATVITPVFKELRGGVPKIVSFSAKRARGAMARYVVQNRLENPADLKKFRQDGYRYTRAQSTDREWLFLREGK
jgi:hypothetical protein